MLLYFFVSYIENEHVLCNKLFFGTKSHPRLGHKATKNCSKLSFSLCFLPNNVSHQLITFVSFILRIKLHRSMKLIFNSFSKPILLIIVTLNFFFRYQNNFIFNSSSVSPLMLPFNNLLSSSARLFCLPSMQLTSC